MTTLLVPGQRESVDLFAAGTRGGPAATAGAGPATTLLDNVKVVHAFSLTRRAGGASPVAGAAKPLR